MARKKWTTAMRKKLSASLKRSWALKKHTEVIPALPTPRKVTIPQGTRDLDAIMGRATRMDRDGLHFTIGQLMQFYAKKFGESS